MPPEFDDRAAVLAAEGPTFRWLYQLLENTHVYTPCAEEPAAQLIIPAEWQEVARRVQLAQPLGRGARWVYGAPPSARRARHPTAGAHGTPVNACNSR